MNLPEDTQDVIYQCRHQLEFKDVLDELIQHEINCKYNVAIDMLRYIFHVDHCGIRVCSIDVSSIDVFPHEILYIIKTKKIC